MKKYLTLLMLIALAHITKAQQPIIPKEIVLRKNSVQFELLGAGYLYSLNYERLLSNGSRFKTTGQIGVSAFWYYGLIYPMSINELISFGKHNTHNAELGAGYTYSPQGESFYIFRLGYRYKKPESRMLFRASLTPWSNYLVATENNGKVYNPEWYFWGGVSIGYTF